MREANFLIERGAGMPVATGEEFRQNSIDECVSTSKDVTEVIDNVITVADDGVWIADPANGNHVPASWRS